MFAPIRPISVLYLKLRKLLWEAEFIPLVGSNKLLPEAELIPFVGTNKLLQGEQHISFQGSLELFLHMKLSSVMANNPLYRHSLKSQIKVEIYHWLCQQICRLQERTHTRCEKYDPFTQFSKAVRSKSKCMFYHWLIHFVELSESNTSVNIATQALSCENAKLKLQHTSMRSTVRPISRTAKVVKRKRNEREPSRINVKEMLALLRKRSVRKKVKSFLCSSFPKTSKLVDISKNFKTWLVIYTERTDTFFSKYFCNAVKKEKYRRGHCCKNRWSKRSLALYLSSHCKSKCPSSKSGTRTSGVQRKCQIF